MRRLSASLVMLLMITTLLVGCASKTEYKPAEDSGVTIMTEDEKLTMVMTLTSKMDSYISAVYSGGRRACEELGYESKYLLLEGDKIEAGRNFLMDMKYANVATTCIRRTRDVLNDNVIYIVSQTKPLVSIGASVSPEMRKLRVDPVSPQVLARAVFQSAKDISGGNGQIAILASAGGDKSEIEYLDYFLNECENDTSYSRMKIADIYYSEQNATQYYETTSQILTDYPDCKCIITFTTSAMPQAAKAILDNDSKCKLAGLGIPSEISNYVKKDIVKDAYLWDPDEFGYFIVQAMDALYSGDIQGDDGDVLHAGDIGNFVVEACDDGGTHIVFGNPLKFDISNIETWSHIF